MSPLDSGTALINTESQSGDDVVRDNGANRSVADMVGNYRENSPSRVVKRFYADAFAVRATRTRPVSETSNQDVVPYTTDRPVSDELSLVAPLLPARSLSNASSYYALQEWEGYVTSIGAETFTADLIDVTRGADRVSEQAEFPLEEIGHEQRDEFRTGSIFRWTIGYETLPSGQRRRVSQLVFRQLPKWTKADIDGANRIADRRHRQIRWE